MEYSHNPAQAGNQLLRFCLNARRALLNALEKPADTSGMAFESYVMAKIEIISMDHHQLRAALTTRGITL